MWQLGRRSSHMYTLNLNEGGDVTFVSGGAFVGTGGTIAGDSKGGAVEHGHDGGGECGHVVLSSMTIVLSLGQYTVHYSKMVHYFKDDSHRLFTEPARLFLCTIVGLLRIVSNPFSEGTVVVNCDAFLMQTVSKHRGRHASVFVNKLRNKMSTACYQTATTALILTNLD